MREKGTMRMLLRAMVIAMVFKLVEPRERLPYWLRRAKEKREPMGKRVEATVWRKRMFFQASITAGS